MAKRRIMKEFKLNEISAVDFPAQEGARMTILKRAEPSLMKTKDGEDIIGKGLLMTTAVDGHAHLVDSSYTPEGGETSWAKEEGEEYGHSHPWIKNADGSITIGQSNGHTHGLLENNLVVISEKSYKGGKKHVDPSKTVPPVEDDEEKPGKEKPKMTAKTDAEKLADVTKQNEALVAQVAVATAVAALSDLEKAIYAALDDESKKVFLAKSADERKAEVAKAEAAKADVNPVVYKSESGAEYRKNDDPRLVEMAKQGDADRKELAKAREASADAEFAKRAEAELAHLPGDVAVKVAVLKAVSGIKDEATRKAAEAMLKANADKLAKATTTVGSADGGKEAVGKANAEASLDAMAKKIAADEKIDYASAYEKAALSPEGKKLYNETQSRA